MVRKRFHLPHNEKLLFSLQWERCIFAFQSHFKQEMGKLRETGSELPCSGSSNACIRHLFPAAFLSPTQAGAL